MSRWNPPLLLVQPVQGVRTHMASKWSTTQDASISLAPYWYFRSMPRVVKRGLKGLDSQTTEGWGCIDERIFDLQLGCRGDVHPSEGAVIARKDWGSRLDYDKSFLTFLFRDALTITS